MDTVFRAEELDGLRLATRGRIVSLAVVALLLFFLAPAPEVYYFHGALVLFAAIGLADHAVARRPFGRPWHRYVFIALDFALMAYIFVAPNPWDVLPAPLQMQLRNGTFVYFFMLLAGYAFSHNPRLMVWAGFAAAASWIVGTASIVRRPDTVTWFDTAVSEIVANPEDALAEYLDPRFVDVNVILQDVIVVLIVAGILAGVVARSRGLVMRQAAAARERANLARYFSPNMVDDLARADEPLGAVRSQPVAVLFADIVGFTA
ncbi:MAG: adenylate/guanylate cyclase domain-containing protein, partial [Alphaproteobacteria bacterium]